MNFEKLEKAAATQIIYKPALEQHPPLRKKIEFDLHRMVMNEFLAYKEGFPELSKNLSLYGFKLEELDMGLEVRFILTVQICLIYEED